MSEGDTVHHAAARIHAVLAGRVPEEILTPHPRHRADRLSERLAGRTVRGAEARGKHLLVRFEGALTLHSHLRMSGTWAVYRRGQPWQRASHRAWLVMRAAEWEVVQFDGPILELMSDLRVRTDRRIAGLGPDVIGEHFNSALFLERLRGDASARGIGDALLDQRIVAGIGNVWKAESCFAVRLDPWRPVGELSDERALEVVGFAREQMTRAARAGRIARPREVYKRAGQRCVRCGTTIVCAGRARRTAAPSGVPAASFEPIGHPLHSWPPPKSTSSSSSTVTSCGSAARPSRSFPSVGSRSSTSSTTTSSAPRR